MHSTQTNNSETLLAQVLYSNPIDQVHIGSSSNMISDTFSTVRPEKKANCLLQLSRSILRDQVV